jgi:hypothetical protein
MSNCVRMRGTPGHAPGGRPAWMKLISILTISLEETRSRDNAAIAATTGAPEEFAESRSSADYAARGVRGEPRGRKSRAGPGTTSPAFPARAEGEKRLLSATRNP